MLDVTAGEILPVSPKTNYRVLTFRHFQLNDNNRKPRNHINLYVRHHIFVPEDEKQSYLFVNLARELNVLFEGLASVFGINVVQRSNVKVLRGRIHEVVVIK